MPYFTSDEPTILRLAGDREYTIPGEVTDPQAIRVLRKMPGVDEEGAEHEPTAAELEQDPEDFGPLSPEDVES